MPGAGFFADRMLGYVFLKRNARYRTINMHRKTPVGSKILTGVFLWFSMRVAVESVSDFVEIVSNAVDR